MTTEIQLGTDYYCRLKHPEDLGVDKDDAARLLDSGTATFRVYDPDIEGQITVAEASGQVILSVSNAGSFTIGDQVDIYLDDLSRDNTDVIGTDAVAGTITVGDVTTDTAAVGNRIRKTFTLGSQSMLLYGTPAVDSKKWGYRGQLSDTGLHQIKDQKIEIEMTLDAGVGLKIVRIECATVVEDCN